METFRCPTCLGVLPDAQAPRCPACGQNLRRRKPKVLGDERRIGAVTLPIDRWMLARLNDSDVMIVPTLAWHGKFATTPMATPDFAATPSQVEAPIEMTAVVVDSIDAEPLVGDLPEIDTEEGLLAPTVGALGLDQYTGSATVAPGTTAPAPEAAEPAEVTEAAATEIAATEMAATEIGPPDQAQAAEPAAADEPDTHRAAEPEPAPAAPAELDPDVRALVDELYEQARAELAGTDLTAGPAAGPDEPGSREPRAFSAPPTLPSPAAGAYRAWIAATAADDIGRARFND